MKYKYLLNRALVTLFIVLSFSFGCKEEDNPIASYESKTELKNIVIEQNSFTPKITWLGGYVSAFAVNYGSQAILNSSLIWLASAENNNLKYPAVFGSLKSSEQNLSESFGGNTKTELDEDNVYTFWLAKENVWTKLKANPNKIIKVDTLLSEDDSPIVGDTLFTSSLNFVSLTYSLDVYINVDESTIQNRGRLGTIYIYETNTSNNLIITWDFENSEITDLRISALGICEGQQFDINNQVWDMYSVEKVGDENIYGSRNIISQPISIGDATEGTRTFYEFPENGLERNKNYYLWIATNEWDGESRGRTANGYATITFTTW